MHPAAFISRNFYDNQAAQFNQVCQDPYSFSSFTPQFNNYSSNNSLQNIYQYKQDLTAVLHRRVSWPCNGRNIHITREDISLINLICNDNPHYNQDHLRAMLAQNSAFNEVQQYLKVANNYNGFAQDIYINIEHFNKLPGNKNRIAILTQLATQAMDIRHGIELTNLVVKHKAEKKVAQKKDKKKVEKRHEQESIDLERKHKQEKKQP